MAYFNDTTFVVVLYVSALSLFGWNHKKRREKSGRKNKEGWRLSRGDPKAESKHFIAFKTLLLVGMLSLLVSAFSSRTIGGGFMCGSFAFCFSVFGLERLTARVVQKGQVRGGVLNSLFWLGFKFIAPAGMIFYGLSRGFSPAAVVVGLLAGVGVFTGILWSVDKKIFNLE